PAIFFRCHIYSFLMRAKVTDSAEGFRRFSSTLDLAKNWLTQRNLNFWLPKSAAVIPSCASLPLSF
ncbi:hypothetical protein, partial [Parafilimonas terrae]|uniref:hypothetical protein n=1 Tax=Parafilimonas terrae TaxID=1465490 RepID=UPI001C42ED86